jgi:hypothetical protein
MIFKYEQGQLLPHIIKMWQLSWVVVSDRQIIVEHYFTNYYLF